MTLKGRCATQQSCNLYHQRFPALRLIPASDDRGDILAHDITSLHIIAANEGCIVCTGLTIKADDGDASLQNPCYGVIDNLYVLVGSDHHQVNVRLSQTIYHVSLQFRVINRIGNANLDIVFV